MDNIEIPIKILDYWIDYQTNKAYCIYQYVHGNLRQDMSDIVIQESKYDNIKKN